MQYHRFYGSIFPHSFKFDNNKHFHEEQMREQFKREQEQKKIEKKLRHV